jgi:hypothetical protein
MVLIRIIGWFSLALSMIQPMYNKKQDSHSFNIFLPAEEDLSLMMSVNMLRGGVQKLCCVYARPFVI